MNFESKHGLFFSAPAILRTGIVVALLAGSSPVARASARAVEITGNRYIATDHIRRLLPPQAWGRERDDVVLRRLQQAYIQQGYLSATIRLERRTADSTLVLLVDEGEVARFGRVRIAGASHFPEPEIRHALGVQIGGPFHPARLRDGIEEMLRRYDGAGFPFAQVWMDSLQLDPDVSRVDLTIHIVEGGNHKVSRIKVEGLQKTREELAVKLSGLAAGEPYDGEKLEEAYLRMSSSGLFEDVAYPEIRLSPQGDGVEALIRVVESRRSNRFSAAFGFADREGTTDRVLSGVVRLDLANIGGTLRDLNVFWRNDGAGRRETRLHFRQRFLFGRRIDFGIRLEQIGLDTLYTWQSLGVETEAPVARLKGGLVNVDLAVYGDRNTFSTNDISKTVRLRVAGGFSYVRGKSGRGAFFEFRNRHTYAKKNLDRRDGGDGGSVSQYIVEARARLALEVGRNVHLTNEANVFTLESGEDLVPLSEQFNLGGASTLRGYRENQFHGRRAAYTRSELEIGRSRHENAYLFADTGYILQETLSATGGVLQDNLFKVGYGFGLRTRSKAGNIDISFGVGEELSLRQTKVHVILDRSF
ncbi:MAG: POTRA domain-containing protein [Candidatus Krumholzibacteria bacterium]